MKRKLTILFAALCLMTTAAWAQELPKKVENVDLFDLKNEPMKLPEFGKKNLMIFYIDPQAHKQNEDFTVELEESHRAEGENLLGFGVINLKDAPLFPNWLVRSIARKRTKKNGALVMADPKHLLRDAWDLGDCNNLFVLLIVSKEGELTYMHKGELTEADKEEFYRVIEKYK